MSDNNPLNNLNNNNEQKPDFLANLVETNQQPNDVRTNDVSTNVANEVHANDVSSPKNSEVPQNAPLDLSTTEQKPVEELRKMTSESTVRDPQASFVQPLVSVPFTNNIQSSNTETSGQVQQSEPVQPAKLDSDKQLTTDKIPLTAPLENKSNSGISIPVDASILEKTDNGALQSKDVIKKTKQGINPLLIAGIIVGLMILGAASYLVRAYILSNQSVQSPTQTVVSNDQMDPLVGTTEENTQQSQQTQVSQENSTEQTQVSSQETQLTTQITTQQGTQSVFTWGTENCKENEILDGEGKCACKTNFIKNTEGLCKYDCTAVVSQITDLRKNPTVKSSDELSTKLSNLEDEAKANSCTLPAVQSAECLKLDNQAMDKMNAKDYNGFYKVSTDYIDKDCSLDKLTTCDKILAKGDLINKILASKPDKKTTKSFQTKLDQIKKDYYANTTCNVIVDRCVLLTQKYSGKTQETLQTEETNSIGKIDPGLIFADDKAYFDKNCKNIKLPEKTVTTQEQQTSTQETQQVKKGVSRKK